MVSLLFNCSSFTFFSLSVQSHTYVAIHCQKGVNAPSATPQQEHLPVVLVLEIKMENEAETHCCSRMAKTTDCAMTKQLGSTMPSSPQILAAHKTDGAESVKGWMMIIRSFLSFSTAESSERLSSPTMSFLICSVMGIGFIASGEMYLVKMLTASFSMPGKEKELVNLKKKACVCRQTDRSNPRHKSTITKVTDDATFGGEYNVLWAV